MCKISHAGIIPHDPDLYLPSNCVLGLQIEPPGTSSGLVGLVWKQIYDRVKPEGAVMEPARGAQ